MEFEIVDTAALAKQKLSELASQSKTKFIVSNLIANPSKVSPLSSSTDVVNIDRDSYLDITSTTTVLKKGNQITNAEEEEEDKEEEQVEEEVQNYASIPPLDRLYREDKEKKENLHNFSYYPSERLNYPVEEEEDGNEQVEVEEAAAEGEAQADKDAILVKEENFRMEDDVFHLETVTNFHKNVHRYKEQLLKKESNIVANEVIVAPTKDLGGVAETYYNGIQAARWCWEQLYPDKGKDDNNILSKLSHSGSNGRTYNRLQMLDIILYNDNGKSLLSSSNLSDQQQVMTQNLPERWLFTANNGNIMKKKINKLNVLTIRHTFLEKFEASPLPSNPQNNLIEEKKKENTNVNGINDTYIPRIATVLFKDGSCMACTNNKEWNQALSRPDILAIKSGLSLGVLKGKERKGIVESSLSKTTYKYTWVQGRYDKFSLSRVTAHRCHEIENIIKDGNRKKPYDDTSTAKTMICRNKEKIKIITDVTNNLVHQLETSSNLTINKLQAHFVLITSNLRENQTLSSFDLYFDMVTMIEFQQKNFSTLDQSDNLLSSNPNNSEKEIHKKLYKDKDTIIKTPKNKVNYLTSSNETFESTQSSHNNNTTTNNTNIRSHHDSQLETHKTKKIRCAGEFCGYNSEEEEMEMLNTGVYNRINEVEKLKSPLRKNRNSPLRKPLHDSANPSIYSSNFNKNENIESRRYHDEDDMQDLTMKSIVVARKERKHVSMEDILDSYEDINNSDTDEESEISDMEKTNHEDFGLYGSVRLQRAKQRKLERQQRKRQEKEEKKKWKNEERLQKMRKSKGNERILNVWWHRLIYHCEKKFRKMNMEDVMNLPTYSSNPLSTQISLDSIQNISVDRLYSNVRVCPCCYHVYRKLDNRRREAIFNQGEIGQEMKKDFQAFNCQNGSVSIKTSKKDKKKDDKKTNTTTTITTTTQKKTSLYDIYDDTWTEKNDKNGQKKKSKKKQKETNHRRVSTPSPFLPFINVNKDKVGNEKLEEKYKKFFEAEEESDSNSNTDENDQDSEEEPIMMGNTTKKKNSLSIFERLSKPLTRSSRKKVTPKAQGQKVAFGSYSPPRSIKKKSHKKTHTGLSVLSATETLVQDMDLITSSPTKGFNEIAKRNTTKYAETDSGSSFISKLVNGEKVRHFKMIGKAKNKNRFNTNKSKTEHVRSKSENCNQLTKLYHNNDQEVHNKRNHTASQLIIGSTDENDNDQIMSTNLHKNDEELGKNNGFVSSDENEDEWDMPMGPPIKTKEDLNNMNRTSPTMRNSGENDVSDNEREEQTTGSDNEVQNCRQLNLNDEEIYGMQTQDSYMVSGSKEDAIGLVSSVDEIFNNLPRPEVLALLDAGPHAIAEWKKEAKKKLLLQQGRYSDIHNININERNNSEEYRWRKQNTKKGKLDPRFWSKDEIERQKERKEMKKKRESGSQSKDQSTYLPSLTVERRSQVTSQGTNRSSKSRASSTSTSTTSNSYWDKLMHPIQRKFEEEWQRRKQDYQPQNEFTTKNSSASRAIQKHFQNGRSHTPLNKKSQTPISEEEQQLLMKRKELQNQEKMLLLEQQKHEKLQREQVKKRVEEQKSLIGYLQKQLQPPETTTTIGHSHLNLFQVHPGVEENKIYNDQLTSQNNFNVRHYNILHHHHQQQQQQQQQYQQQQIEVVHPGVEENKIYNDQLTSQNNFNVQHYNILHHHHQQQQQQQQQYQQQQIEVEKAKQFHEKQLQHHPQQQYQYQVHQSHYHHHHHQQQQQKPYQHQPNHQPHQNQTQQFQNQPENDLNSMYTNLYANQTSGNVGYLPLNCTSNADSPPQFKPPPGSISDQCLEGYNCYNNMGTEGSLSVPNENPLSPYIKLNSQNTTASSTSKKSTLQLIDEYTGEGEEEPDEYLKRNSVSQISIPVAPQNIPTYGTTSAPGDTSKLSIWWQEKLSLRSNSHDPNEEGFPLTDEDENFEVKGDHYHSHNQEPSTNLDEGKADQPMEATPIHKSEIAAKEDSHGMTNSDVNIESTVTQQKYTEDSKDNIDCTSCRKLNVNDMYGSIIDENHQSVETIAEKEGFTQLLPQVGEEEFDFDYKGESH